MEISKCRSCGADIFWIEYKGKKHPVDAVSMQGFREDPVTKEWELERTFKTHFATCPDAKKWRKKK